MTVPPRQVTPSLLQIDAILVRLRGDALAQEVCRFLQAEIVGYAWVGIYRALDGGVTLSASDGGLPTPGGPSIGDPALAGQAVRERRPQLAHAADAPDQVAVPVFVDQRAVGALAVMGTAGTRLDTSDRRFLEDVARRVAPTFEGPTGPRLL